MSQGHLMPLEEALASLLAMVDTLQVGDAARFIPFSELF